MLFNFVSDTNISDFFAPSLAASGLGLMVNGLKRKELVISEEHQIQIKEINPNLQLKIIDEKDDNITSWTWVALIFGILLWYSSCSGIHLNKFNSLNSNIKIVLPYFLGVINYFIGALITFIKE